MRIAPGAHTGAHTIDAARARVHSVRRNPDLMQTIMSHLKKPSTWVILVVGALIALAFGRFLKPLKKVADAIPGSDAKS